MNVKKAVYERVKHMIQTELDSCNSKIRHNLLLFKRLQEEQTILKRERVKLTELLRSLTGGNP